MKVRLLSFLLTIMMLVGMMPITTFAASEITEVELTITEPVIGANLDFTADVDGASPYTVTDVDWTTRWDAYYVRHNGSTIVETGQPYTVYIYLEPKEGYSFAANTDDIAVTINGSSVGITKDLERTRLTCMLTYEELGYTISFDANGGTGTMADIKVYDDYTLPACGLTAPEGKAFIGWAIDSAEGTWYYPGKKLEVNTDMRLYAKWAEATGTTHTITFVNEAFDPPQTKTILVNHGTYTLPECLFETATSSRFGGWWVDTNDDGRYEDLNTDDEIFVTGDMEIYVKWDPIVYRPVSNAEFKATVASEYKHGMLAGSVSVSLENDDELPICMVSGGYGHGYWISSDDMLLGTDALSTLGGYKLYVRFKEDDDCSDALICDSNTFKVTGDFGNITPWSNVKVLPDGTYILEFDLPAVPGTELSTENITFTLNGYEADETITAITVGVDTPHISLRGSGYGSRLDAKSYMIWKDYYDYGYGIYDGPSKFENSRFYYLEINYALDEGYSFPASFWDGDKLIKDKFKLSGFEKAEVYQVGQYSIVFRLPQLGNTVIENVEFILNGYEEGKAAENVTVTILDKMIFPRDDLDYFFYDESVGFSPEGAMRPIPATVFENGERYYIAMLIGAADGYDASELEMEDFTIHTPYGSCTATGYGRATAFIYNEYYYVGFELPVITNASFTTYTVSFDADGGTGTMSDVTGVFGEYTLPANGFTAPEGKQFKAWSVNGKEKAVGDKITVTADTTITAIWEAVEYDVTVTGGTASVGAGTPITKATMGTTVTLIANNAPSGKVFDKWIVNGVVVADANSATTTFTMPAGNVTAQATYKDIPIVTYTVSFNANGGSGEMADVTGMSGDYLLPMCTFTAPAGKQFKCWAEDSVNGTQYYAGYGCVVDSDVTFYAIWEDIPVTYYTVTFDSNGGSAVTAQSIEAGQKATKPADPTKDGYDFKGWTLNGSAYDFNTAVNGNITLVAAWEQQQVVPTTYTVSFAANGGSGSMADVTGISGEYTLPANGFTAPEGKQFKAWSVNGSEKAVGDKITVTADTTVTAVWENIPAGHTCDIKPVEKVKPSCTEGGKEAYYKCEGCGKFYEDALGAKEITDLAAWGNLEKLGHTESGWKSDKDNHWKECTVAGCGVIIENSKAAHKDDNNDGKCDVCEYNVGKPNNKPSDDVQSPQTGDNSMMWLWVALLFVSGFGVVATTTYGKKRSSAK